MQDPSKPIWFNKSSNERVVDISEPKYKILLITNHTGLFKQLRLKLD